MNLYKVTLTAPYRDTTHTRIRAEDIQAAEFRAINRWYRKFRKMGYIPDELEGFAATAKFVRVLEASDDTD